ncbi:MAG: hypothetical protein VX581_10765 [Chloroflexota bacterium]|nr:hypothetical protein [Chloroflexota bacterium]
MVMVLDPMDEEGLDISSEPRNQPTPELVDAANTVIVMAQRDSWPDYLVEGSKVVFWEISDSVNVPRETAQSIMDQIKGLVEDGERLEFDSERIIEVPERALAWLGVATVILAAGLLIYRLQTQ